MVRLRTGAGIALLALVLAGCTGPAAEAAVGGPEAAAAAGITAVGVGTVRGNPDTLTLTLGVQTRAASAGDALAANTAAATALIDTLKGRGVADADLQTSQVSIGPTFEPESGAIGGYEVTNQLTVTLRDLARAGEVIDAAAAAAGDAVRVQQIGLSIADDSAARAQARADAVAQAQAQAQQLAEAAGVDLGPIRSIREVTAPAPPVPFAADALAQSAAVPIEPGTQELTVTVEIVYGIAQ